MGRTLDKLTEAGYDGKMSYIESMIKQSQEVRDCLMTGLKECGLPIKPF